MTPADWIDLLEGLQPIVYGAVTAVAAVQWRRRPGAAGAWLTATFGVLVLVLSVEQYLPEPANPTIDEWIGRLQLAVVAFFPFCLYQFMATFIRPSKLRRAAVAIITAVIVLGAVALPSFEEGRDERLFQVYLVVFGIQWVTLSGIVAVGFWRAGRGQPTVARRRMRTMSVGAVGLALAFVIGIAPFWDSQVAEIITYVIASVMAPLMLMGFAPPYALRMAWRKNEEAALRRARLALMQAETRDEINRTLLRHARTLVGARAAFLQNAEGQVLAGDRFSKEELASTPATLGEQDREARPGLLVRIPMSSVRVLVVVASPFTPFFGRDEIESLEALAALAELALARADLLETQSTLAAEAERANHAKSEFLSRMSHELRTPLNSILGFAQLLEMDLLEPEQHDSVEQVLKAGRHLLELIEEVLDIARIEEGRLSLSVEAVRVQDALDEAVDLVKPLAAQRRVDILAGDVSLAGRYVLADRQRLKQVLLNLLANAIKYNREGGSVTLSCEVRRENLRLSVADTGRGIAPGDLDRLFTPFERLGAEQTGVEGTGIGLALSKRLVELMGGFIGADSRPGRGSTFWVELALATHPIEEHHPEPEPHGLTEPPRERSILYIEDNPANLKLVERILTRRPGVRLISAMQGGLGIELARQHHPDVILLDVHLPDMGGEQVLAQLRADEATAAIPVVVVSAEATKTKIQRILSAGAHAYLTKPLDVAKFLAVIDETLDEEGASAR